MSNTIGLGPGSKRHDEPIEVQTQDPVEVESTDLDIRDLDKSQDSVEAEVTNTVTVQSTDLDIRDLDKAQDSVEAEISNTVTVQATDLDIRDISSSQDSIEAVVTSPLDSATGAVEVIDYAHHEVHSGSHFSFSAYNDNLDTAGEWDFIVTTPDTTKWAHMIGSITGALQTLFEIYEDTTHTTDAAQSVFNNNRNSATSAGVTIHTSNDDASDGTRIFVTSFGVDTGGGANKVTGGGSTRGDSEFILKQNTKYLFRTTSNSDDNNVNLILSWYEHTNA